jgi:hypothetical protein
MEPLFVSIATKQQQQFLYPTPEVLRVEVLGHANIAILGSIAMWWSLERGRLCLAAHLHLHLPQWGIMMNKI